MTTFGTLSTSMKKIIIRTPNFIGDTVNTLPAIELLKQEYPDAVFTIVGPLFVRDLFSQDKRITRFISCKKGLRYFFPLLFAIRKEKYDLGILFNNTFIFALIFRLSRIKCLIGYKNEGRGFLLNHKPRLNRNTHYINRYAYLVNSYLNNKYTFLPPLHILHSGEATFHFENDRKTIGFYPGSPKKKFRQYPASHTIELLKQLSSYNIVMLGDSEEHSYYEECLQKAGHPHALNLAGKISVEQFINTISNIDLLITIDSAAMHIAAATHTPFIALMGLSTSPVSCITPKVDFGKIIRIENNLIDEEKYLQNITPQIIIENISAILA